MFAEPSGPKYKEEEKVEPPKKIPTVKRSLIDQLPSREEARKRRGIFKWKTMESERKNF